MKNSNKNKDQISAELEKHMSDAMANYLDLIGGKPMLGRIWGLLLSRNEPMSLTEIAKVLGISKPAASNTINNAMTLQIFTKVYNPEFPRENFFIASPYTLEFMFKAAEKKTTILRSILEKAVSIIQNPDGTLFDDDDIREKHKRLDNMKKIIEIISNEYREFIERVYKQISDKD